jgi:hypothetical protein
VAPGPVGPVPQQRHLRARHGHHAPKTENETRPDIGADPTRLQQSDNSTHRQYQQHCGHAETPPDPDGEVLHPPQLVGSKRLSSSDIPAPARHLRQS